MDEEVAASPWFMLAESTEECWSCGEYTPVFAILLPSLDSEIGDATSSSNSEFSYAPCCLTNISSVNSETENYLRNISTTFYLDHSGTVGQSYWMNHCGKCSSKLGDFYLHSKPGHAFFPISDEELARIRLTKVDIEIRADAGWGQSSWIDDLLEKFKS